MVFICICMCKCGGVRGFIIIMYTKRNLKVSVALRVWLTLCGASTDPIFFRLQIRIRRSRDANLCGIFGAV